MVDVVKIRGMEENITCETAKEKRVEATTLMHSHGSFVFVARIDGELLAALFSSSPLLSSSMLHR
jgi:hypothetical protein